MKKHKIKNIDKLERDLPLYDGTNRIIKFGEILESEPIGRVRYMINNGLFEDLGGVEPPSKEEVDKALKNIDEEQEDFLPKDETERKEQKKAIKEEYEPKPHKKKGKYKKYKKSEDD